MGASRKLQGEIDRVLKKVQEGVDVFDSIWNKVYDTDNANQKEKFEADLKKEIKKLQRYRDQIKTWIQSSEIKDKKVSASYEQALVDARKVIEREMERFKICEKETKTKAFSKEGLGQQPKTDPKEKAKSETRDWLNNVVGELESQIDSFEAEIEGLSVKKGKTRPPRLTHLETSIARHKAHIMKLELILRLLDNDELSPEQVNDVKDFLDDYVERNQENFEEFNDVDELYNSLPLDKVESLEELVAIGPPGHAKGVPLHSLKNFAAVSPSSLPTSEQPEDAASQDNNPELASQTPPPKVSGIVATGASTQAQNLSTPLSVIVPVQSGPGVSATPPPLPSSTSVRLSLESATTSTPPSPAPLASSVKDEEVATFPGRRTSSVLSESGLGRGVGRGSISNPPPSSIPFSSGFVPVNVPLTAVPPSDLTKRNLLGIDERLTSNGLVQPLSSPLASRMILPQAGKTNDAPSIIETAADSATIGSRVFAQSLVPGSQWRSGSAFPNQNESGQIRTRTEIPPDQREKYLQRFQQVQQLGMPPLSGGNSKHFPSQQNPLLPQFNSQSSSVSSQTALGLGVQTPNHSPNTTPALQQSSSLLQQSNSQVGLAVTAKDTEIGHLKVEESLQSQNISDDPMPEPLSISALGKNNSIEDELKASYGIDSQPGVSSSLTDITQLPRDTDLSLGQPVQPSQSSSGLGMVGRRSVSDLGAVGESINGPAMTSGTMHDQLYTMQMLEAGYHKLPQPRDSERPRTYTPKHPVATPSSYPQVQAPIVSSPAFWERQTIDNFGADTLFFAFYYQQNTYQQYLAAKELKKQSWRYHRKYNTWFQRHEEPKVATDEFEQGTYVYFDFHVVNDDLQHGWCQRIKTEFTFEYNYLEDELNA